MFSEPGTAREEAERLVAALLAAATVAANANPQWSTGSSACCVCPLCKVIAAVRDPDPEVIERVATGAGDLAAGVASFLRHLASPSTSDAWHTATAARSPDPAPDAPGPQPAPKPRLAQPDTVGPPDKRQPGPEPAKAVKKVVKKAVKKTASKKAG